MSSIEEAKKRLESGMLDDGRAILLNIVKSEPDNEAAWMLLCGVSSRTNDWELGAISFKKMSELRPQSSIATSGLVQSYYHLKRYKDALLEIKRFKAIADPLSDEANSVMSEHENIAKEITNKLE